VFSRPVHLKLCLPGIGISSLQGGSNVPNHCYIVSFSAKFKYVEALGRIIIGGPYPPTNVIIYVSLGNNFFTVFFCGGPWATARFAPLNPTLVSFS